MDREEFIKEQAKEILDKVMRKLADRNDDLILCWIKIYLNDVWLKGYSAGLDRALDFIKEGAK